MNPSGADAGPAPDRDVESAPLEGDHEDPPTGEASPEVLLEYQLRAISGPLPPPGVMRGYEDLLPGAADRIMRMAEKAQDEGIRRVRREGAIEARGQWFAFALGALALILSAAMAFAGYEVAGLVTFLVSIAGLAGLFLTRGRSQRSGNDQDGS